MVTSFFNKREHLGGKHVHQKIAIGDDHPKKGVYIIRMITNMTILSRRRVGNVWLCRLEALRT